MERPTALVERRACRQHGGDHDFGVGAALRCPVQPGPQGCAGLTVVDLDDADAIAWARTALPATLTVETTRGQHWIYRGAMTSRNDVRPGVDVKSLMVYARWLGHGTGARAPLPDAVRALAVKKPPAPRTAPQSLTTPLRGHGGDCPHRTPTYLERGVAMAVQRITEADDCAVTFEIMCRTFVVVQLVPAPRVEPRELRAWSLDETLTFLEAARTDRLYTAFVRAIALGLRRGEILGLQWRDVDLDRRTLTVRTTLNRGGNALYLDTTKNRRSRVIPIPTMCVAPLR